MHSQKK